MKRIALLFLFSTVAAFSQTQHGVSLTWAASSSCTVAAGNGYNVKRSTTTGGPYTPVNTTPPTVPCGVGSFLDPASGLTSGTKYFYVVTALVGGVESVNSNEASVTFLLQPNPPSSLSAISQ
jgi:hypothetical protein